MEIRYLDTLYYGEVVGVPVPLPVCIGAYDDEKDWCLQGRDIRCGSFLSWVTGGTYRDEQDREKIYPGPRELTLRIKESQTYPGMEKVIFPPVLFHFRGVVWRDARHSTPDSVCGGVISFTCSSFEVEGEADTPVIVEGK